MFIIIIKMRQEFENNSTPNKYLLTKSLNKTEEKNWRGCSCHEGIRRVRNQEEKKKM